jgi:hypothetical protein
MAAPIRPTSVSGLRGWYRARAVDVTLVSGKVSQWSDRSGLGNHLLQSVDGSRPVWVPDDGDGREAVMFNSSIQQYFDKRELGVAAGSPMTIVINQRVRSDSVALSMTQSPAATKNYGFLRSGAFALTCGNVDDATASVEINRSATPCSAGGLDTSGGGIYAVSCMRRTSTPTLKARCGTDTVDQSAAAGTVLNATWTWVGAFAYSGTFFGFYNGTIRELMFFDRDITDGEYAGLLAFTQLADIDVPVIGNFSPALGTSISRSTPIAFDVTDDSGSFRRVFITASFGVDNAAEVVHDGSAFRGPYVAQSTRGLIANGFRFTCARSGGWPGRPTFEIHPIDMMGNEGV